MTTVKASIFFFAARVTLIKSQQYASRSSVFVTLQPKQRNKKKPIIDVKIFCLYKNRWVCLKYTYSITASFNKLLTY